MLRVYTKKSSKRIKLNVEKAVLSVMEPGNLVFHMTGLILIHANMKLFWINQKKIECIAMNLLEMVVIMFLKAELRTHQ